MKNKKVLILSILILVGLFLLVSSRAQTYTEEIRSVSIDGEGYTSNIPGSWKIDKSAKWIGKGKAEVVFDVKSIPKTDGNNIDIVLVMDVSGSMSGSKLDRAKEDAHELIDTLLSD